MENIKDYVAKTETVTVALKKYKKILIVLFTLHIS